jgi:hypothetical protein
MSNELKTCNKVSIILTTKVLTIPKYLPNTINIVQSLKPVIAGLVLDLKNVNLNVTIKNFRLNLILPILFFAGNFATVFACLLKFRF